MIYIQYKLNHDKGISIIKSPLIRDKTLEEIKKEICEIHLCPERAIEWVRVLKPSIYQIKKATQNTEPLFFSKPTLKFFGQKMKDFKVYHVKGKPEEFHLVSKTGRGPEGEREYIFNAFTLTIRSI